MSDPGPLGLLVFLKVVMLNIKSKGYEAYSNIQAKVLPIPTTSATRLWGQNTFLKVVMLHTKLREMKHGQCANKTLILHASGLKVVLLFVLFLLFSYFSIKSSYYSYFFAVK